MGTSFLKSRFSKKAVFCTCYEEEKTKALLFWFALLWFGLDVWLLMYLVGWIPGCWVVWFFSVLVVLCLFVCLSVCFFVVCLSVSVCLFLVFNEPLHGIGQPRGAQIQCHFPP